MSEDELYPWERPVSEEQAVVEEVRDSPKLDKWAVINENKSTSYNNQKRILTKNELKINKITSMMGKLGIVTSERLRVLRCLVNGGLTINQVKMLSGGSYHSNYFHLEILARHGFVSHHIVTFPCVSRKAKSQTKDVSVFTLTDFGREAVEYFTLGGSK